MFHERDIPPHTTDVRDLTPLTVDACAALVPSCALACWGSMAEWPLPGRHRQSRRYTTAKHCPLPTPADRLLGLLVSLQQPPMPRRPGRLGGMRQATATPGLPVVLPG